MTTTARPEHPYSHDRYAPGAEEARSVDRAARRTLDPRACWECRADGLPADPAECDQCEAIAAANARPPAGSPARPVARQGASPGHPDPTPRGPPP